MIKILKSTILLSVLIAMSIAPANASPVYNLTETDGNNYTIVMTFQANLAGSLYTNVVVDQLVINGVSFFGSTELLYSGQYDFPTNTYTDGGGYIHATSPSLTNFFVINKDIFNLQSFNDSKIYLHAPFFTHN